MSVRQLGGTGHTLPIKEKEITNYASTRAPLVQLYTNTQTHIKRSACVCLIILHCHLNKLVSGNIPVL